MPPLILLVDDFTDALEMYRDYLVFRGYRVATAKNGQEALDAAAGECPDLILMDIQMPLMNGTEAMHILRTQAGFASTPIVALTAHAFAEERLQLLMHGFDEVIAKPCLPNDLEAAVERFLNFKRSAMG
jgi:CheY-like chemotaxis protein